MTKAYKMAKYLVYAILILINMNALINNPSSFILAGQPLSFCQIYRGEQHLFLFGSLENVGLPNGAHSSRKDFAPKGANSLLEEWTPSEKGDIKKRKRK